MLDNLIRAFRNITKGDHDFDGYADQAEAELVGYKLRLDLLAKGATWEHEENAALREEVERLRALLKTLEYIEEYPSEELLCPICRGEKPTHYEDCDLAAALKG